MQKFSSRQLQLKNLKRQAHRISKEKNISKGEALQALAKEHNFNSWQELRDHVLRLSPPDTDKIPFHKYNSSIHNPRQIIGVSPINEESTDIQIRISMISLFYERFDNIKDLREFFDNKITEIISNSKLHAFIFLLLHLNEKISYPISDFEGFLDNLKSQYPKIINFNVKSNDSPPRIDFVDAWIKETNKTLDDLLRPFQ